MPRLTLEFDAAFRDYNFSTLLAPAFPIQVTSLGLTRMLDALTATQPRAAGELADVFTTTLRHGTYEGFQRTHGPRPIDYGDWCLAKAGQFFDVLGLDWNPDDVLNGQPAERLGSFPWFDLVPLVRVAASEADGPVETILRTRRGEPKTPPSTPRGWGRNRERDSILVAMRSRGESNEQIVREPDLRAIAGLPCMKQRGIVRWADAYNDVDLMMRIDQFINKAYGRRKAVK